jgi:dirigent-like protein
VAAEFEPLKIGLVGVDNERMRPRLLLLLTGVALLAFLPAVGEARSARTMDIKVASVLSGYSQPSRTTLRMTDKLYNLVPQFGKPKGALVGSDSGTLKKTGTISFSFSGVARLPGGTLNVKGEVIGGEHISNLTIAGGTGRFAGARGVVVIRELGGRGRAANIFHVTLR